MHLLQLPQCTLFTVVSLRGQAHTLLFFWPTILMADDTDASQASTVCGQASTGQPNPPPLTEALSATEPRRVSVIAHVDIFHRKHEKKI